MYKNAPFSVGRKVTSWVVQQYVRVDSTARTNDYLACLAAVMSV